ncbi:MAG: response regulator [Thiobacillaceae bacterium]|jgi:twitching motility two-component system response regulator PilH|nr:response regulator [Hydrogenophilales bacterium]MBP9915115.1 response regulator [Thiobacillaceae bacterium]
MPVKRVLIIDDSPTERFFLTDLLRKQGYDVLTAESGELGVAVAKMEKPDLILMDVVMPGLNGFQATRQLARNPETESIPVMMCTTKGQETDRVWGLRQGAVEYLVKPVVAEELLAKIKALG